MTGASGGIGEATARRLAGEHYSLLLTGRREAALRQAAERAAELTPHPVRTLPADLRSQADRTRLIAAAREDAGGLDALVLCSAAAVPNGGLLTTDPDDVREAMEVKVHASLALVRDALPALHDGHAPAVVFVAGTSAHYPTRESLITSLTNAALLAATGVLADELAPQVRVVAVSPGPTRTARWQRYVDDQSRRGRETVEEIDRRATVALLSGRMVEPEEVAAVIAFVADARATAISGTEVRADGGYLPPRRGPDALP